MLKVIITMYLLFCLISVQVLLSTHFGVSEAVSVGIVPSDSFLSFAAHAMANLGLLLPTGKSVVAPAIARPSHIAQHPISNTETNQVTQRSFPQNRGNGERLSKQEKKEKQKQYKQEKKQSKIRQQSNKQKSNVDLSTVPADIQEIISNIEQEYLSNNLREEQMTAKIWSIRETAPSMVVFAVRASAGGRIADHRRPCTVRPGTKRTSKCSNNAII